MVAVKVEDRRRSRARLVSASTTVRPVLARKAGGAEAAKSQAPPSRGGPPSGRSKRRAPLRSSCAGRPLDGSGGAGGSGARRSGGSFDTDQSADRAGLLAIMQQDGGGGARGGCHIDEGVDPGSRSEHQRAVARRERLGRLAVEGHNPNIVILNFDCNNRCVGSH